MSSGATQSSTPFNAEYRLTDSLAQCCLPAANRDEQLRFAWANSVCALFLFVGLLGLNPAAIVIRHVEPVDEVLPAVFEMPPLQPVVESEQPPEDNDSNQDNAEAPQIVVVAAPDANVTFSVPTIGNVVAASAILAPPPPANPNLKPTGPPKVRVFTPGVGGGFQPEPEYPRLAQQRGYQGTVNLLFTIDETGALTSCEVKESSGYQLLDNCVLELVKKRWVFTPGQAGIYTKEFKFQLGK